MDRWQENIRRLIGTKHGRRVEVARKAGMSPGQLGDLINRPERNPELRQLQRVADALGVDLAALFVSSSETTEAHGRRPEPEAAVSIDLDVLKTALRNAIAEVLVEAVAGLARAGATLGGPLTTAGVTEAADGDLPSGTRGDVRRKRSA